MCAITTCLVEGVIFGLRSDPDLLVLNPTSLEAVLGDPVRIGDALGRGEGTSKKLAILRDRPDKIGQTVAGLPRPGDGCIEYLHPDAFAGAADRGDAARLSYYARSRGEHGWEGHRSRKAGRRCSRWRRRSGTGSRRTLLRLSDALALEPVVYSRIPEA